MARLSSLQNCDVRGWDVSVLACGAGARRKRARLMSTGPGRVAAAALPRRLGGFPFWRGGEPFLQAIEPTYTRATSRGLDTVLGQTPGVETPGEPKVGKSTSKKRPRA